MGQHLQFGVSCKLGQFLAGVFWMLALYFHAANNTKYCIFPLQPIYPFPISPFMWFILSGPIVGTAVG